MVGVGVGVGEISDGERKRGVQKEINKEKRRKKSRLRRGVVKRELG